MTYAVRTDVASIAADHPALHREIRRYPVPVQLALAALEDILPDVRDPAHAALISVACTEGGSPEIHHWVRQIAAASREGRPSPRMNPTHTLHVVDNLALSAASIRLANREPGWGLGGGPGQCGEALDLAHDLLATYAEVILLAADQDDVATASPALGLAVVLRAVHDTPRPVHDTARSVHDTAYTTPGTRHPVHDTAYTTPGTRHPVHDTARNGARELAQWLEGA